MAESEYLTVAHLHTEQLRRIFSKIRVEPSTGCWLWTGSLNTGGYGNGTVRNVRVPIHRLLYAWLVEPLPRGLGRGIPQLDHFVCDTRRCVNPSHLKLGPARDNVLRGKSIAAKHAVRTHCKNGHPLPDAPNREDGSGRRCKLCKRDARQLELHRATQRRYLERQKLHRSARHPEK